jgi:hypothetical protein
MVVDENEINAKLHSSMNQENVISATDLIGEIKIVKNLTQIEGMKAS